MLKVNVKKQLQFLFIYISLYHRKVTTFGCTRSRRQCNRIIRLCHATCKILPNPANGPTLGVFSQVGQMVSSRFSLHARNRTDVSRMSEGGAPVNCSCAPRTKPQ